MSRRFSTLALVQQQYREGLVPSRWWFFLWINVVAQLSPAYGQVLLPETIDASSVTPSAEEIERSGAVIGEIVLRLNDVFDLDNPKENNPLFKLANQLHINTRENVIRNQLLFRRGDVFSKRKVEETERILRANSFLYGAVIRPFQYRNGVVDLEVTTRDYWTLIGGVSVSREGGNNRTSIKIQDENIFGFGKRVGVKSSEDEKRTKTAFSYLDPLFTRDRLRLELVYSDNSDGYVKYASVEKPFFALDSHWSYGITTHSEERVDDVFFLGRTVNEYGAREYRHEGFIGYSEGLVSNRVDRWSFGITKDVSEFSATSTSRDGLLLPQNRDLAYPWVGFSRTESDYVKARRVDRINRTEDINFGMQFDLKLGWSSNAFGGDGDQLVFVGDISHGYRLKGESLLLPRVALSGRARNGRAENAVLDSRIRYFRPLGSRQVTYGRLELAFGRRLDEDKLLVLGGDTGLRGYPSEYHNGDRRYLFTLEQRYYFDWHVFQLFYVGAAAFFDIGSAWTADTRDSNARDTLRDIGIGLRVVSSRSASAQVLHFDFAFPLDGDDNIDPHQIIFVLRATF